MANKTKKKTNFRGFVEKLLWGLQRLTLTVDDCIRSN